jgi:hypothetical protein
LNYLAVEARSYHWTGMQDVAPLLDAFEAVQAT